MTSFKNLLVLFVALLIVSCNSDDDSINPFLDSDEDGIVDINDLCPNTPGTVLDQGCYLLTNINLSSGLTYSTTLLNTTETQITNINGLEIVSEITKNGSVFSSLDVTFNENGTFIRNGEYLETYVIKVNGIITEENAEIISFDNEEGFFSVNNDSMTILLNVDTYNVILFDESELRMTLEQTYSENNIDYIISREIRMVR
tara:strand:+ start:291 stop:893 length:603 start_codon:yes stop_codon:yes gene_type:complete